MKNEVLVDKQYKNYNYISRYSTFPIYYHTVDNKSIQTTTGQLDRRTDYVAHKVKFGDTYDSLSLTYYNSPLYYWIIADFNGVQDTLEPLKEGSFIKIPSLSGITYQE